MSFFSILWRQRGDYSLLFFVNLLWVQKLVLITGAIIRQQMEAGSFIDCQSIRKNYGESWWKCSNGHRNLHSLYAEDSWNVCWIKFLDVCYLFHCHRICEHCRKKNPKVLNYIYIIENEEISTTGSLQWILWRLRLKTGRISYLYNVMAEGFCPFIRAEIDLGVLLVISALDKSTHIKFSTWFSWCKFAVP